MGRGRSSSGGSRGGSSSSGRGWSSSSGRGWSSSGRCGRSSHTTVIIGGNRYYGGGHGSGSLVPMIVVFFIIALVTLFAGVGLSINNSKYDSVYGTAVDNRDSGVWYYTTYSYTVDGIHYVEESDVGWELPEDIGKNVKLYYEKDTPSVITEENPKTPGFAIVILFIFSGSFGTGAIMIIRSIIKGKKDKTGSYDIGGSDTDSSGEKSETRCPYCGAKHNGKGACSSCGASGF